MSRRAGWRTAGGLILLSAIPVAVGALRLLQLAGGPDLLPAEPRFDAFPVTLVLHILSATVFAVAGAFQFVPALRRHGWHRRSGRMLTVAGLVVTTSALWLTLAYDAQPGTGPLLLTLRLVVAVATAGFLLLGVRAIRRRDIAAHRTWMTRTYALALGAGTQILTEAVGEAVADGGVLAGDLAKGAGWLVNLAVAEWTLRDRSPRPVPA